MASELRLINSFLEFQSASIVHRLLPLLIAAVGSLLLAVAPASGQCDETTTAVAFEFPPTPPHTSAYVSRSFPPNGLEFHCQTTSCEYNTAESAGAPFPLHDVFSSLIGDGNDLPYFAVDGERVVFRYRFSPTTVGDFEASVTLSEIQEGETACRVQPLQGRTVPGLCVYVNEGQAGGYGHTYLQLLPTRGTYAGADFLSYGLYPDSFLLGTGEYNNEAVNSWDARICFRLTDVQYDQARALLDSDLVGSSPDYSLFSENCQHYVRDRVRMIGLTELDSLIEPLSAWERIAPIYLLGQLQAIGHGNAYGPFAVVELNGGTKGTASRRTFESIAYSAVATDQVSSSSVVINGVEHPAIAARITFPDPTAKAPGPISLHAGTFFPILSEPHEAAAFIGMPLHEITLPDVDVGLGDTIIAQTLENEISVIHWGYSPVEELAWDNVEWDEVGFPTEVTAGPYFHSYDKTGVYPVTMAALSPHNRIYIYRWNIIVGEAAQSKDKGIRTINIPFPDDPLFPWENGPFTPPINPIAPGDVFFDGFESGDTSRWN